MSDQFIYEDVAQSQEDFEPFVRKQLIYCQDNVSNYSGTILLETSSLASSGLYANLRDAWLEIPFVVKIQASSPATAADQSMELTANAYMVALKSGYHSIINSITVEINGTNCVQQTSFTNMYVSYKLNSSFGPEDLRKNGPTIGFHPDTSTSYHYATGATAYLTGVGLCNNEIYTAVDGTTYSNAGQKPEANQGLKARLDNVIDYTTYSLATAGANNDGGLNTTTIKQVMSATQAKNAGFNIFTDDGGAVNTRVYSLHIMAHIRLKDVADFFEKLPIIRAPFLKLTIGYNGVSSQTITYTKATSTIGLASTSIIGQFNPVVFSSARVNNPNNKTFTTKGADGATAITDATKSLVYSANVGATGGVSHIVFQNCRLYCPMYQMSPTMEKNLLSTSPTKRVIYKDIYSFVISSISAGSSFNSLVTSSIINPKTVIVIPILNSTSNVNTSPLQSPFCSDGCNTSPYGFISSFQVQVSGSNVFQNAVLYDFEMFTQELAKVNSLNGNQSTGLTSGLISHLDFQRCYRYYVADVSRRVSPAEDNVPKSITVQGINSTQLVFDYYVFVEFEREIVVNVSNGRIETL